MAEARRIVCNPADDSGFVRSVAELARQQPGVRVFEANLRTRYPDVAVVVSVLANESVERWYVYRDGKWAGNGSGIVDVSDEATAR